MALNPHFNNFGFTQTQNLTEDLIIESIKIYGVDVYYIPRTTVNDDDIFRGDDLSTFDSATIIEMYVKNVEGYEGQGDFLSKFGLQIQDRITFTVAKKRFEQELSTLEPLRPKEGDLIWFPMANDLFEISFTEHEEIFYQMGKLMTYSLSCERFIYSDENLDTGIEEIDSIESRNSLGVNLEMKVGGTGDYVVGETVTGSLNNYTAEVGGWDSTTRILTIINYTKKYLNDEILVGSTSGASHEIQNADYLNISTNEDNKKIQDESDTLLDFSETDPFSEGLF